MNLKSLATAATLVALTSGQAVAMDLPAPMPEFRSPQELQAEAASRAADAQQPTADRAPIDTFYTGKPQDRESGKHIFLFRSYDPTLGRWTSFDPVGFPDGANNASYVATPTSQIDPLGLFYSGSSYDSSVYGAGSDTADRLKWNLGKGPVGFTAGINVLGWAAMDVADGTAGTSSWALTTAQSQSAKYATDYYSTYNNPSVSSDPANGMTFASYLNQQLVNAFKGTRAGSGSFSIPLFQVLYPSGTDAYFAFGHAALSLAGTYSISDYALTYNPTVSLADTFTFAPYASLAGNSLSATGTGFRLQDSGYIIPFQTTGSWAGTYSAFVE